MMSRVKGGINKLNKKKENVFIFGKTSFLFKRTINS